MVELESGWLWHCSKNPAAVITQGFSDNFCSSNDGRIFFTPIAQPCSNIIIKILDKLKLYSGKEYGKGNPPLFQLLSWGFDGIEQSVQIGDSFVQIGQIEIVIFSVSVPKLSKPVSYYYGEENLTLD